MKEESRQLEMSFEPKTIEHLGVKMYSHVPPALAELIANAYDACAKTVQIRLYNDPKRQIIVEDDGVGMTFNEINKYFLRIGRNRREENQEALCGRIPTGKKGLGKLALFGIGSKITIITRKKGKQVTFILDWEEILNWDGKDYTPSYKETDSSSPSGTTFILENLKRSTDFPIESYAVSISKLFNFKDQNFKVFLSLNDGEELLIDNKLKYRNISEEFKWTFAEVSNMFESDYESKDDISGIILTTEKPLKPGLRGITLFANGRMVNAQEFFGATESSHFFSYATGWLDVDFIDNLKDDLISTDRQSINWENDSTAALRVFLQNSLRALEQEWRKRRKEKRIKKVQDTTEIDIDKWLETVPASVKDKLQVLIGKVSDSELSTSDQGETISNLYDLVPEYPQYHWRHLDDNIKSVSKSDYERGDYIRAAQEGVKLYEKKVKEKSYLDKIGVDLMGKSFGPDTEPLKVSNNITDTDKNIESGQKHMSMGLMAGFRNPSMHEPKDHIYPAIYNDADCLDLLSMMSYLFKKLENARNIND
ncbi:TIGR02391 family protein [Flagellimonas sp.]|uniref:TIGR02391 family protein n=1 Tax=Flagellimonas sp. TaxID=2058762 RepID=UPI003AB37763